MIHLLIGGSASGKSEAAENICTGLSRRAAYVAAMKPFGEPARKRIERHLALRAGKGLATIEQYTDIGRLAPQSETYDTLLIECMTNLVANELFRDDGTMSDDDVARKIAGEVAALAGSYRHLVIVTCDVFGDGIAYSGETTRYMRELGSLNRLLAGLADAVTEVYYGISVPIKPVRSKEAAG